MNEIGMFLVSETQAGPKQRYKTVNLSELSRLAGMPDDPSFPEHYAGWVGNVVKRGHLCRDDVWTAELAVVRGTRENGRVVQTKTATQNNGKRPPRTL